MATKATVGLDIMTGGFVNSLKKVDSQWTKFKKNIFTVKNALGLVFAGAIAKKGIDFLVGLTKEGMKSQNAMDTLSSALETSGKASTISLDALTAYAAKVQQLTKFDDEATMSAEAMMLTFNSIGKDTFPRAMAAAVDLAQKFGGELADSAQLVGRALETPESGMAMLIRKGIAFSEEQKKMIKGFIETGDKARAMDIILKQIDKTVGGLGIKFGKTTSGQIEIFKNSLANLKEAAGLGILNALRKTFDAVAGGAGKFAEFTGSAEKLMTLKVEMVVLKMAEGMTALAGAALVAQGAVQGLLDKILKIPFLGAANKILGLNLHGENMGGAGRSLLAASQGLGWEKQSVVGDIVVEGARQKSKGSQDEMIKILTDALTEAMRILAHGTAERIRKEMQTIMLSGRK